MKCEISCSHKVLTDLPVVALRLLAALRVDRPLAKNCHGRGRERTSGEVRFVGKTVGTKRPLTWGEVPTGSIQRFEGVRLAHA